MIVISVSSFNIIAKMGINVLETKIYPELFLNYGRLNKGFPNVLHNEIHYFLNFTLKIANIYKATWNPKCWLLF